MAAWVGIGAHFLEPGPGWADHWSAGVAGRACFTLCHHALAGSGLGDLSGALLQRSDLLVDAVCYRRADARCGDRLRLSDAFHLHAAAVRGHAGAVWLALVAG